MCPPVRQATLICEMLLERERDELWVWGGGRSGSCDQNGKRLSQTEAAGSPRRGDERTSVFACGSRAWPKWERTEEAVCRGGCVTPQGDQRGVPSR